MSLPFLEELPYVGIFATLVLIGLGLPIPEDVPLLATGFLAHEGTIAIGPGLAVAYTGLIIGDTIIYGMGHHYGSRIVEIASVRRYVTPKRLARAERYFDRYGLWTIFVARFIPGLRGPTFLTAGTIGLPLARFLTANAAGGLVSVPLWVGLGYFGANHVETIGAGFRGAQHWIAGIAVLTAGIWLTIRWYRGRAVTPPEAAR